jgi:hypothetical protein
MDALEKQLAVLSLLRAEFQRERASEFALLRRIPSTGVRRFLDYFSALDEASQDALAEAMSDGALTIFFPHETENPYRKGNIAYKQYVDAQHQIADWKYENVQMLRSGLAASKQSATPWIPDDVARRIEAIRPVKSTEIRKVVKLALSQTVTSLKISQIHPGYWLYEGDLQDKAITIHIDYSNRRCQLDYGIAHPYQSQTIGEVRVDLSYEKLMGLWAAEWDCLEQANLDQSVALLKELISHCHRFVQSLPSPNTAGST